MLIELNNGCQVCMPLRLFPELQDAFPKDLERVEIMGVGQAIAWPSLDQQFDVLELLADGIGAKAPRAKSAQRRGAASKAAPASLPWINCARSMLSACSNRSGNWIRKPSSRCCGPCRRCSDRDELAAGEGWVAVRKRKCAEAF